MNIREAREILKNIPSQGIWQHTTAQVFAKGFIEAHEQAEVLVKKLENVIRTISCDGKTKPCDVCTAKEALKTWREGRK